MPPNATDWTLWLQEAVAKDFAAKGDKKPMKPQLRNTPA